MIKIFFFFSQQTKQIERISKLTSIAPTYANFKKMNISLDESLKAFDHLQTIHSSQSAKTVNNLLTYVRKVHNRAVLRSRQNLISHVLENLSDQDHDNLPALMANITYTQDPELFISQACDLLIKKSTEMNIKALSNCAYSLAKIARKNIQMDLKTEKLIAYNAAQLTLKNLMPLIQLKISDCNDEQIIMETLVAYQKLEIYDMHEFLYELLSKLEFKYFGRVEAQIIHTLSKSDLESPTKHHVLRSIYNCFEDAVHQKRLNLKSMIVGLHALQTTATHDLVEKCMELYCEEYKTANIQDLCMMTSVLFKKGIMSGPYSRILTESYEALKLSIDINVIMYLIPNMSTMINLKLLEKKFINQFLISIKILNEKGKINRNFYENFKREVHQIENEEIQEKFKQIFHLINRK
ncbi:unnamed protein product [Paramecium primaurelia]|uniref:Uncharacterized protein n=1 Tax=Paramecium primaurelia TaxID=5886 RepID=A0A8S1MI87_PARPR|nr:unnamed protein product [Paramecium primaurelia]